MYANRQTKETQRDQDLYDTNLYLQSNLNAQPGRFWINVVSFAHNFKVRLLNADPQQQRQKELVKDLYRKELEKQMIADKQRKEQQIQKRKAEDEKYEREFYQQKDIEAARKNNKSGGQPYLIMRSAHQRTRRKGVVKAIIPQVKLNPEASPSNKPVSKASGREVSFKQRQSGSTRTFPQIVVNRHVRDTQERVLNQYTYEDERLSSIQHLQQAIMKKMDSIKSEITKASISLDTQKEIERIRSMLKSKSIYTEQPQEEDADVMYYLSTPGNKRRKGSVMDNRSLQYYARSANQSVNQRANDEQTDLDELYDRVEILPLNPSSKRKR